ncbi:sulfite reductase (NADPH) hemoprotein, beta-component [Methylocaldum marinum]|uniref:Sulfite reductase [NADPH] hemoprotein beta-component n=1 Tax=Methylocaldum marinum TaxID=1432792 RepID=A0A250KRL9_9GAMM|nr:assimilatory sulfite reductase (NADPH) hemoprotein subunit [Methylocaldum marinum]BBA34194.1 sulfite reductase (NADPH) hemoprotein, beta-component [Methylocaldum marinum]
MEERIYFSEDEDLKARSRYLRGTIEESLADPATGAVSPEDAKLLKFHGTYLQDDRDLRNERQRQKLEPAYGFMVRVRMPGGVCTPGQWLQLDELARRYGQGSLRITTRQTFQFHGVVKRHLKATIAGINHALLNTIAACGDVNRNVVCHNNPYLSPLHGELYDWSRRLSTHLLPKTRAYHEIWLDEERVAGTPAEEEPLYGRHYLPRKFKIGIALLPHNDIDVYAQDLGFIAIADRDTLLGFNIAVGGGMGMSHNEPSTYPRLGEVIGFCRPDRLLDVAEKVLGVQRDFGDRSNRKHARLKYTLDDRGTDWFKAELETRLGWALEAARPFRFESTGDRFGWIRDGRGHWHLTLGILSGRLRDTPETSWLTGLREIAAIHEGDFRLTANQNLIIARISDAARPKIDALLDRYRIPDAERWSGLRRNALSCVALPTCGLAMAESERWLPTLLARLEPLFKNAGLEKDAITLRVTGCPNGCARPHLGEIGLVGKSLGRYNLYLGAGFDGSRLNALYREGLSEDEIVEVLSPMIAHYARERRTAESFGDFVIRAGYVSEAGRGREFQQRR